MQSGRLHPVIEGIETEEQYQQLKMLGCEFGQGYLFSRPVNGEGMVHLLAQDAGRDVETDIHLDPHVEDSLIVSARLVV